MRRDDYPDASERLKAATDKLEAGIAEQELKKQKEKEEEAKKAQEPKASPAGEEEDA